MYVYICINIIISIIHGVDRKSSSAAHTPAARNGDYRVCLQ